MIGQNNNNNNQSKPQRPTTTSEARPFVKMFMCPRKDEEKAEKKSLALTRDKQRGAGTRIGTVCALF